MEKVEETCNDCAAVDAARSEQVEAAEPKALDALELSMAKSYESALFGLGLVFDKYDIMRRRVHALERVSDRCDERMNAEIDAIVEKYQSERSIFEESIAAARESAQVLEAMVQAWGLKVWELSDKKSKTIDDDRGIKIREMTEINFDEATAIKWCENPENSAGVFVETVKKIKKKDFQGWLKGLKPNEVPSFATVRKQPECTVAKVDLSDTIPSDPTE